VCDGVFTRVPEWAERAFQLVRDHEFSTFLFGVHLTPRLEAVEELLDERFPSPWAEPLRREFNRELGKAFERALAQEGRAATVDFRHPDVRFTVDLETGAVELGVSPVYFFGRYRKLVRGIPQTHWPCRECGGRGCERCGWTGKMYPVSVEELILPAFLTACQGETGHFHGAGREDTDARMLGRGRPFVLEIVGKKRTVDLAEVARRIEEGAQGQVEVCDLRPGDPKLVEQLKVARMDKRYRARVSLPRPVKEETLRKALAGLVGEIEQRTPTRVRHRRADKVRRRCVHEAQGRLLSPTEAEVELLCEGGLYVKELITGDEGATHPSLSQLLGMPAQVIELDVLEVLDDL
jgi:tRNA pseudouridine synthase 10